MSKKIKVGGGVETNPKNVLSSSSSKTPSLKFAMVCSSNMNRSMEAHKQLKRKDLDVYSYGVGTMVRLPAPNNTQAVFEFGTPYKVIYDKLVETDNTWYRNNGLLEMVERNIGIKHAPERWQLLQTLSGRFDIVFCFEERVFDGLMDDVNKREPENVDEPKAMHIVNLEVTDNTEEATTGGQIALEFCEKANDARDSLDEELPIIVEEMQAKYRRSLMHMTVYI